MSRKLSVLLVALLVSLPTPGFGSLDNPTSYDECIVGAMRGVSSDVAANAIIQSCRELFPQAAPGVASQAAPVPVPAPAVDVELAPASAAAVPADRASLHTGKARSLTDDELSRLGSSAKVFGSSYRVTIDNDNPNLTLTEVTIAVWDDSDSGTSRKEYSEAVRIAPQTSAMVKYTVHYRGDDTGWNWGVVSARGVE